MSVVRVAVIALSVMFSCDGVRAAGPLDRCRDLFRSFLWDQAKECLGKQIDSGTLDKDDLVGALKLRSEINELSDGDLETRIADLTRAIALKPTDAYLYNTRGIAYQRSRRYQAAIDDYAKYISLWAGDKEIEKAWGYGNTCNAYLAWGKLDEALVYCNRALKIAEYPAALVARGDIRFRRKDYDLAVADHSAAIRISASNSEGDGLAVGYLGRAKALEALGRRDRASADARIAAKQIDDLDKDEQDELRQLMDRLGIRSPAAKPAEPAKAPPAPPKEEVAADPGPRVLHTRGYNGTVFVKGTFTRNAKGAWEERNSQNGAAVMVFREVEGGKARLLLHDRSRDLYITVDLARKKLTWRTGTRGPWNTFYDIERIQY